MSLNLVDSSHHSQPSNLRPARLFTWIVLLITSLTTGSLYAADLDNVDAALQKLAQHAKQSLPETQNPGPHGLIARLTDFDRATIPGRFDSSDRVLVHIHLDGTVPLDQIDKQIESLRGQVLATNTGYQQGIIAAYLPTDQIENSSNLLGVRSLTMEHKPENRVGKYTAQSAAVLQTDVLNKAGLKGDGITVGVLSDSFNTAYQNTSSPPATTAAQDVATGDLPVVNVLQDFPDGTDEGRAMCQVVYDEAPHCKLAFATAFESEVGFANNIVLLRSEANCNVIVDDVGYYDEPVFSDGMVAQAVNAVVTSKTLPGKPAVYLSAAGNDGNNGFRDYYRNLSDAEVRKPGNHGNLKLNVTDPSSPNYLDPSLTAGGWFNWNPNGGNEPVTTVEAPGPVSPLYQYAIFLQWDDLFDQEHGITTNYNFLVFDADGNYLAALSSTTNSFSVQQPFQGIGYLSLGTQYQIAVTKTKQTDPKAGPIPPTHQLAMYTTLDGLSNVEGKYFTPAPLSVPNIYGHPAADGAIAVAAYAFNWRASLPYAPQLDNYTSPGPVTIEFDQNYQRLAVPETRLKPEVAGIDGSITTFFGPPYYNYPFAFFGTSCAAPSVAGVVALMLEGAGGPDSLDAATVKLALENSTAPRNSTLESTQALVAGSGGFVSVTALGQNYFGPNYFTVNYFGGAGNDIESLTINGTAAGLTFDTQQLSLGTLVGISASDITVVSPSAGTSAFTLKFKKGIFTSGVTIGFTLPQDFAGTYPGYTQNQFGVGVEAEDLAYGAIVSATFGGNVKGSVTGAFLEGAPSLGYSPADGFGLVNAVAAVESILPTSEGSKLNPSQFEPAQ